MHSSQRLRQLISESPTLQNAPCAIQKNHTVFGTLATWTDCFGIGRQWFFHRNKHWIGHWVLVVANAALITKLEPLGALGSAMGLVFA